MNIYFISLIERNICGHWSYDWNHFIVFSESPLKFLVPLLIALLKLIVYLPPENLTVTFQFGGPQSSVWSSDLYVRGTPGSARYRLRLKFRESSSIIAPQDNYLNGAYQSIARIELAISFIQIPSVVLLRLFYRCKFDGDTYGLVYCENIFGNRVSDLCVPISGTVYRPWQSVLDQILLIFLASFRCHDVQLHLVH